MAHDTTFAPSCTGRNFRASHFQRLADATSSFQLAPILANLAASSLVAASAGLGAVYAWSTGSQHGIVLAVLFVLMAIALEIAKPLAVAASFTSFRSWAVVRGGALALLATVAVAYSLTAELTLMAGSRGDVVAQREATIKAAVTADTEARRARDRYEAAKAELVTLPAARPAAQLVAQIDGLLLTPGADNCAAINGKVTREVCPQVAELKAEKARAERRAELEMIIATPLPVMALATTHDVREADPGAAALATYFAAMGFTLPAKLLTEWLALVPVLALEVGSAVAGVLVQAVSPIPTLRGQIRRSEIVTGTIEPQPVAHVGHGSKIEASDDTAHERERVKNAILGQLKERGGEVDGSQRGLAALIG